MKAVLGIVGQFEGQLIRGDGAECDAEKQREYVERGVSHCLKRKGFSVSESDTYTRIACR